MRWVGIDEAGYGPNLGPMVMTAVAAERVFPAWDAPAELDLWTDLAATVDRAGGDPEKLWVDDSKAIHRCKHGRDRLDLGCLAAVDAAAGARPGSFAELAAALGVMEQLELEAWTSPAALAALNGPRWRDPGSTAVLERRPLVAPEARWRISGVAVVVVGPARFNQGLAVADSKATVHFEAFARLLGSALNHEPGGLTRVVSDIHGGRRYYLEPLGRAFPDVWIERGREDRRGSCYTLRTGSRTLDLELRPKADGSNGLCALASMVSKSVRELWMEVFNAFWLDQVEGLKPTAGYPVDAARFRAAIEQAARARGLDPRVWWREK